MKHTHVSGFTASSARLAFAALALFASTLSAAVFDNPAKQMKGDGLKHLPSTKRILIPTAYSENLIAGVHKASKGGAHAKINAANIGITPDLGQKIADVLLEDLVTKIKATGREVLLYQDVKDSPAIAGLKPWAPHKTHKLPIANVNLGYGDLDYLVSTPTGVPIQQRTTGVLFDAGSAMRYGKLGNSMDALVIVPTYRFQAPIIFGSARGGIAKSYASVGIAPSMQMTWGGFQFLTAKGAWGSYIFNGNDTVTLLDEVGTLEKTSESKTSDTSLFDFSTFRSMARSGYLMTIDADAYFKAAIEAGKEMNTHFVAQFK